MANFITMLLMRLLWNGQMAHKQLDFSALLPFAHGSAQSKANGFTSGTSPAPSTAQTSNQSRQTLNHSMFTVAYKKLHRVLASHPPPGSMEMPSCTALTLINSPSTATPLSCRGGACPGLSTAHFGMMYRFFRSSYIGTQAFLSSLTT